MKMTNYTRHALGTWFLGAAVATCCLLGFQLIGYYLSQSQRLCCGIPSQSNISNSLKGFGMCRRRMSKQLWQFDTTLYLILLEVFLI